MVNIPFVKKLSSGPAEKIPEWVIVELQGDLQTDSDILAGQEIGTIHLASTTSAKRKSSGNAEMDVSKSEGKAIFLIGNYALTGEVVILKKPLVLIRKSKQLTTDNSLTSVLEVDAVIRKKLLFRERPRHVIPSSALPKAK